MNLTVVSEQIQLIERGRQLAEDLGGFAPDTAKAMLMTLLCRVEIRSDRVGHHALSMPTDRAARRVE